MAGGKAAFDKAVLAEIPATLEAVVAKGALSGFVTLVWQGGEIVQLDTVGKRNLATDQPMERGTIFRIASMTKPVTSTLALMAMEEGKLRLDDPITKWLPEFADMQVLNAPDAALTDTHKASRAITVEDLLTHRSGLAYGFSAQGALARAYDEQLDPPFARSLTSKVWLERKAALPMVYDPGEHMHYSQSTDVLGFLLARLEGKTLGALLKERIFDPLGMADTAFYVSPAKQDRAARLYTRPGGTGALTEVPLPIPDAPPPFEGGGEGLYSTVDDYLKFARMLLGSGAVDGVRLLKPETVDLMASNHLTPAQRAESFLGLPYWESMGFGLGLSVIMEPEKHGAMGAGGKGSFGWPGAFGTWWQADPVNDMILIYLIQNNVDLTAEAVIGGQEADPAGAALVRFQQLAYQAKG